MPERPGVLDAVGATARWTAAARALERRQPAPLVDDPWAERLAGASGMAWAAAQASGATLPMVVRARFFDDWLTRALRESGARQAVLLGAGLDTRAWRLSWPAGTRVYEIDRAPVLGAKAAVLAGAGAIPMCDRVAVSGDLATDWEEALEAEGFIRLEPTVWLAEGILFYLPDPLVRIVLGSITRRSAPGSRLGFDIPNRPVLTSPWTRGWVDMQAAAGAPWLGTMDDPAAELGPLGWSVEVGQPGEGDAGYGRWTLPVIPAAAGDLPHSWYVTAVRTG